MRAHRFHGDDEELQDRHEGAGSAGVVDLDGHVSDREMALHAAECRVVVDAQVRRDQRCAGKRERGRCVRPQAHPAGNGYSSVGRTAATVGGVSCAKTMGKFR